MSKIHNYQQPLTHRLFNFILVKLAEHINIKCKYDFQQENQVRLITGPIRKINHQLIPDEIDFISGV